MLDVVSIVEYILGGRIDNNATRAYLNIDNGSVTLDADGFVGAVQMTLIHNDNFSIDISNNTFSDSSNPSVVAVIIGESPLLSSITSIPNSCSFSIIFAESRFTATNMGQNFIKNLDTLLEKWEPQPRFHLIKVDDSTILDNHNPNPISTTNTFKKEIAAI